MAKTMWKHWLRRSGPLLTTEEVAEASLTSDREGQIERIEHTAENGVRALGRLVSVLEKRGLLTCAEVQHILDTHSYEPAETGQ